MDTPNKASSRWVTIGILAIIALLALNVWLLFDRSQKSETIETQAADLAESEKLKAELEKQYYESLSELEEMRGDNEEMNKIIDQQKAELATQKDEISRMIRDRKDLTTARGKMKDLEAKVQQYLAELDALREQNALLTQENTRLSGEKSDLESNLQQQIRQNDDLNATRTALSNEKSKLENQNKSLSAKVNQASVVPVTSIEVTGYKVDEKGKESKKRYADNIDRLKICFNAGANNVAEAGREKFYIRLVTPTGQTLAVEDMGSGILTTSEGDQVRFSVVKEFDYNKQAVDGSCISWDPGIMLEKGLYQVEVYNKGYLTGTGSFKLK